MTDSPGWASPGSSPSEPSGDKERDTSEGSPEAPPEQQPPQNWAAQQPPPAGGQGWAAAPPPPGQPGWNGGPGWHGGPGWNGGYGAWHQAPAPAKPGVIPLRPLGVGEILDGAVSTARAHWRTALGVALGIAALVQLASTLASGLWLRHYNEDLVALQNNPAPTADEVLDGANALFASTGVEILVTLIGTVVATAMLTIVVSRAVLGRSVSIGDAWQEARPRLLRMLGLTLCVMLIVIGSIAACTALGLLLGVAAGGPALAYLGLLAGTVVGVWLWVRYCLAAPALMLEKQGVATALRRSAKLVRDSWWRIFGIQLLALLLVLLVGFIVQVPASVIASVAAGDGLESMLSGGPTSLSWGYLIIIGIGATLASAVTLPLNAGITALLYMDQRIRREALDLELARAAGVEQDTGPGKDPGARAPGS